jgi:ankyrin repeat protein
MWRSRKWRFAAGAVVVGAMALAAWLFSPGEQQRRRNVQLLEGARSGDCESVEAALDAGADVNGRDRNEITPLMHAARGDSPEIANPGPTDHPNVVELLIKRGANVNAKTDSGFVALFWAARYGHLEVAKLLIAHGADVNAKDRDGMTALRWASTNQHAKVVEFLREAGAAE